MTRSSIHIPLGLLICFAILSACSGDDENLPPSVPDIVRGSDSVGVDDVVEVIVVAVDPENGPLTYEIDWDDGRDMESIPDVLSGLYLTLTRHFFDPGLYRMRCRVMDREGRRSAWSAIFPVRVGGTPVTGRGDWWMFMRDAQHSGSSPFAGPLRPKLAWSIELGSPVRSSASYDRAGTIYVGGDNFLMHAFYPDGGNKWTYWTGNARISNSPAIHDDGAVCFGSSSANIYRVNRYGIKEWNYSVKAPILRSSAALDTDGRLYIGGGDRTLYCLTPHGDVAWQAHTNGAIEGGPALSRSESHVYIGSGDQILYAYDRNGNLQWTFPTGGPITGSPTIGPGGRIFIGSADAYLYALSPEGRLLWRRDLRSPLTTTAAVTDDGTLYAATTAGILFCVANDGSVRWDTRYAPVGGLGSPAVDVYRTAYIGSPDGNLTAISGDGRVLWRFDTEGPINTTPSIGKHGIAVGNDRGTFLLLQDR